MKTKQNRAGASLKQLRISSKVPQPLVAAMAGTSTAYLAKVEDGLIVPTTSYMQKATEAIVRLMQDPPKPCPVLGCDNTTHVENLDGRDAMPDLHHADEKRGAGWIVSVERMDGQDTEWVVYAEVSDDVALAAADFLAFSAAYQEASAYAAVLNGRGVTV